MYSIISTLGFKNTNEFPPKWTKKQEVTSHQVKPDIQERLKVTHGGFGTKPFYYVTTRISSVEDRFHWVYSRLNRWRQDSEGAALDTSDWARCIIKVEEDFARLSFRVSG